MTNEDWIRSLSDKDLAGFIVGMTWIYPMSCPKGYFPKKCKENKNDCSKCYYEWLKQEKID